MSAVALNDITKVGEKVHDSFHAMYVEYLSSQQNNWVDLATIQTTKDEALNYAWYFDYMSSFVEQGAQEQPTYNTLSGDLIRVPLVYWQNGLRLPRVQVETDKINKLFQESVQLGKLAAWFNRDSIVSIIANGTVAPIMYDGFALYSNTHNNNGNTYDNLMAGAISDVTLSAAWTAMMRFPNSSPVNPKPLGIKPDVLVVPPDLKFTADQFLHNSQYPVATFNTENVYKNLMEVRVEPTLTDVNDWYVFSKSAKVLPFVHGKHETLGEIELVSEIAPDSYAVLKYNEYRWTARFFQVLYPTHPFLTIKFVN